MFRGHGRLNTKTPQLVHRMQATTCSPTIDLSLVVLLISSSRRRPHVLSLVLVPCSTGPSHWYVVLRMHGTAMST